MSRLSVNDPGNRILGVLWCTLAFGAGTWLILHGIRGVRARRIRRPYREYDWYTGRAAVIEGSFRIVVGVGIVALVVWVISTGRL
jgi:hypothetical protein